MFGIFKKMTFRYFVSYSWHIDEEDKKTSGFGTGTGYGGFHVPPGQVRMWEEELKEKVIPGKRMDSVVVINYIQEERVKLPKK